MSKLTFARLRERNTPRSDYLYPECMTWNAMEWACALTGEAGELANFAKKLRRVQNAMLRANSPAEAAALLPKQEALLAELSKELADVVLYADLMAAKLRINLEQAIIDKFAEVSLRKGVMDRLDDVDPTEYRPIDLPVDTSYAAIYTPEETVSAEKSPPANCRERLRAEGKPYPKSSCAVCGTLIKPNWSCPYRPFKRKGEQ